MQFTFIEEVGIHTDLVVLKRETQPYTAILYQHQGELAASAQRIHNQTDVTPALKAFISKALETNADLALAPEYCCPWTIVKDIIQEPDKWPQPGKLWVMGCESITLQELTVFQQTHHASDVHVHFEESVLTNNKNFMDPLVYLFRGTFQGQAKLIVLIQFKTWHMGVWSGGDMEANNLIMGQVIYVLKNSSESVHFFSLICSEAMNFQAELDTITTGKLQWHDKPYLIFNPQLNPDPTHPNFCDFRKFLFTTERKELITLNWSNTSTLLGPPLTRHNSSRSGFWLQAPSAEINLGKTRVKQNHKAGIYYFSTGPQKHTFILNSSVHLFHINNWSVHITAGQPVQRRRQGPEAISIYALNVPGDGFELLTTEISDGHIEYLQQVQCTNSFLNTTANCILEKEILVCLTSGKLPKSSMANWFNIPQLFAWQSDEDTEPNNRITFAEDEQPLNLQQRTIYLNAIRELESNIFTKPDLFPPSIHDLRAEQLRIGYTATASQNGYKFNVCNAEGVEKVATIIFLDHPVERVLADVYSNARALFDNSNRDKERVVVFYRRGNDIHSKFDEQAASITNTGTYSDNSILKEKL